MSDFEFYLKSQICAHNTAMKYLGDLKKIVLLSVKRNWLAKDPFLGYNMSRRDVQKEFLIDEELQALTYKTFVSERLTIVRDIFLFSGYTGLAYADVNKLKPSEIRLGIDGKKWLFIRRQKTGFGNDYLSWLGTWRENIKVRYMDVNGQLTADIDLPSKITGQFI